MKALLESSCCTSSYYHSCPGGAAGWSSRPVESGLRDASCNNKGGHVHTLTITHALQAHVNAFTGILKWHWVLSIRHYGMLIYVVMYIACACQRIHMCMPQSQFWHISSSPTLLPRSDTEVMRQCVGTANGYFISLDVAWF